MFCQIDLYRKITFFVLNLGRFHFFLGLNLFKIESLFDGRGLLIREGVTLFDNWPSLEKFKEVSIWK